MTLNKRIINPSVSKLCPCCLRCRQEPGDLADGNMSGHLVNHLAPVHIPQTKNNKLKLFSGSILFHISFNKR